MLLLAFIASLQQPAQALGPTPYWQQRVAYEINARLDEPSQTLSGDQRVRYINNSPDTLRTISFHLYLNAFRPGSRWSAADSAERKRRFNDLKDPDYGFNHVRDVKISGTAVEPIWPLAPDSTVVRFTLPKPMQPGDTVTITMDWDARTSIPPRRQGRRGRSYDFAQWYPRVVAYDKHGWEEHALYPAGEFYGEFGDFVVQLDVPKDQVVGATGEPECGDPGWPASNRGSTPEKINLDFPPNFQGVLPVGCGNSPGELERVPAGRKRILWIANNVHHFAMSMSPDYRYEGGEWNGILIHVLYQPGDEKTWGGGIVVNNTINTMKWLDFIFGKYPWPQMTVVHRIEGGGTEFPMMQMNGSPSQGLNLHEGGHTYLMGILANNEWKEGWMDEGFTSFQTTWWSEAQGKGDGPARNLEAGMLEMELNGQAEPVSTQSEKFRDFDTYDAMIYNRGELFLHELKRMVGDETMLKILRTYYARWKLRHVEEEAFRAVAEEVSKRDLSAFFAQWLHNVVVTDYALGTVKRLHVGNEWRTTVEVVRKAPGQFPVRVAVLDDSSHLTFGAVSGVGERETVVIMSKNKPWRVVLDPEEVSHDWNYLNNQRTLGFRTSRLFGPDVPTQHYFDTYFSPRVSRDALTIGWMPTLWRNDVGGATIGFRTRNDYLGMFEQYSAAISYGTGIGINGSNKQRDLGIELRLKNPVWWRIPSVSEQMDLLHVEGRNRVAFSMERERAPHLGFGPTHTLGGSLAWNSTYDLAYLQPGLWQNGGTFEGAVGAGVRDTRHNWDLSLKGTLAGGVMYTRPGAGVTTVNRYDAQAYTRPELEATAKRSLSSWTTLAIRGYAAGVFSPDPVLYQRQIYAAGADPYQTMGNPFLRSMGAPLMRDDCWCRWHSPGGGNLRGYDETLSGDRIAVINTELEGTVLRPKPRLVSRVALAAFGDVGILRGDPSTGTDVLGDAGLGIRFTSTIGRTTWTTRVDFPMYVGEPGLALAHTEGHFGLNRMVFSLSPVIK